MAKNKVSSIISNIIVVILIIGVIGVIAYFTNGFTSNIDGFQVKANGATYRSGNTSDFEIPSDTDIKFTCKNLLGGNSDFTVEIEPNGKASDFDFYVDGQAYSYAAESDYTKCFDLTMQDDGFTINIPSDISIIKILQKLYDGKVVKLTASMDTLTTSYFVLVIISGNSTINIPFRFQSNIKVESIELDRDELLLW
jgi:cytochrome c biogenesis protein ResB